MLYRSTRDNTISVSAARAIVRGISHEGGLFVPESFPRLALTDFEAMLKMDYQERACAVLSMFLGDFDAKDISESVSAAYGSGFASEKIAPISKLSPDTYVLELWHGPTCAFKDMALQLLPHLMTRAIKKDVGDKNIHILVATSGDTGKAALEGFKDVPGVCITVYYPRDGVSRIQKLQMVTQDGANVNVVGIHGNFDETQTAVKRIFADAGLRDELNKKGTMLSSANSINWGRLVPQIVYYIGAYCELMAEEEIKPGEQVNIAVPTGNFGNILAAYYAKRMGLPVNMLICASNVNKVLTDFINTGIYDKRREFFMTSSPSMDILISSNLERLLYHLTDADDATVAGLMRSLSEEGVYTAPEEVMRRLRAEFYGGFCGEEDTAKTIREIFEEYSYLCDTHTAVALGVYRNYVRKTGDHTKTIVASTANPFKFAGSILKALNDEYAENGNENEFEKIKRLAGITGLEPPRQILDLETRPVRFNKNSEISDLRGLLI